MDASEEKKEITLEDLDNKIIKLDKKIQNIITLILFVTAIYYILFIVWVGSILLSEVEPDLVPINSIESFQLRYANRFIPKKIKIPVRNAKVGFTPYWTEYLKKIKNKIRVITVTQNLATILIIKAINQVIPPIIRSKTIYSPFEFFTKSYLYFVMNDSHRVGGGDNFV